MALTETKCRHFWIVSAVFILLSASLAAEQQTEGHRCHWCGPLAEQVHRSRRASSCNGDITSKVTVCDEGLPYCAIVASSPPYVESRFCVKVYQDECYTVYCNSTKTWRITCPCRGELCNSNNTKRENEAFQALLKNNMAKLSQNKRLKRALIAKAGFVNVRKDTIDNTTEEINGTDNYTKVNNNIVSDETNSSNKNTINDDVVGKSEDTSEMSTVTNEISSNLETSNADTSNVISYNTGTSNDSSDTSAGETKSNESSETETETETESVSSESSVGNSSVKIKSITENNVVNEPSTQIDIRTSHIDSDDLKTEIFVMSSELPKLANDANNKITEHTPVASTTPVTKATTMELKLTSKTTEMMQITPTASKKLPAAEALQHNEIPTTETREQMTTSTPIDIATQTTAPRNNTAVRVDAHILTLILGVILHY